MQATRRLKNPRKQRKLLHCAPSHVRHKLMAAPLSKELAASKGAKTLPVRKGDTIRIMRGDHSGFEGKISRIDLKRYRIYVEGLTREKVDGTNIFVAVHPSKVMIRSLNLDDKWRKSILDRKHELELPQKEEKATSKTAREPARPKGEKPKAATSAEKVHKERKKTEKGTVVAQKKPLAKKEEVLATTKRKSGAKRRKAPSRKEESVSRESKTEVEKKPSRRKTAISKKEGGT